VNSALYAGLWLVVAQVGGAGSLAPRPLHEMTEPESDPSASPATPSGAYRGVVPGPEARNPLPVPRSDPPRLIWTGFKMAGDRSEIFLQTTRPVEHQLAPSAKVTAGRPGSLSVLLRNCRIHLKNNARRIDTRFFASPVQEISARQRKRDVELNIALKQAATPEVRIQQGGDGTYFVVLSFAGTGQPGTTTSAPLYTSPPLVEPPAITPGALTPPPLNR
jgi:hypothetical protein